MKDNSPRKHEELLSKCPKLYLGFKPKTAIEQQTRSTICALNGNKIAVILADVNIVSDNTDATGNDFEIVYESTNNFAFEYQLDIG